MLLTKSAEVVWAARTKKHYIERGYEFTKMGDSFIALIEDVTKGSHIYVEVLCDYCEINIVTKQYKTYIQQNERSIIKKDCCLDCSQLKLQESNLLVYGKENTFQVKEHQDKQKQTLKNRYGVEYISQMPDHQEKVKKTSIEKYGFENPSLSPEIQAKTKKTNLERYGKEYYTQTDEYLERVVATNQEKYGVDWYNQSDLAREKYIETCQEKYGVGNYFASEEFKDYIVDYNLNLHGVEHYSQTDEYKEKFKATSQERYGVDNPNQHPDIIAKRIETNIKKYGFPSPMSSPLTQEKARKTLYANGTAPTSKQQLSVYEILKSAGYSVELNFPLGRVSLDVALFVNDYKIDIEYDGWYWHKNKQKEDRARDEFTKENRWKVLRIKSYEQVPVLEQIEKALDRLIKDGYSYTEIIMPDIYERGDAI